MATVVSQTCGCQVSIPRSWDLGGYPMRFLSETQSCFPGHRTTVYADYRDWDITEQKGFPSGL